MIGKLFPIRHLWTTPTHPVSPPPSCFPRIPGQQIDFSMYLHMGFSFISPIWCHDCSCSLPTPIINARVSWLGVREKRAESSKTHVALPPPCLVYLEFCSFFHSIYCFSLTHRGKQIFSVHRLGGTCTPSAFHMNVHMCIHLHKPACAQKILDHCDRVLAGFYAEVIYFRITVHYFCSSGCNLFQLPTGCVFLKRPENPGSMKTRSCFIMIQHDCCMSFGVKRLLSLTLEMMSYFVQH